MSSSSTAVAGLHGGAGAARRRADGGDQGRREAGGAPMGLAGLVDGLSGPVGRLAGFFYFLFH